MSRIFISCIILVIFVHSSCIATSVNVAEIAGHAQSEFEIPYAGTRQKRANLGTDIHYEQCVHIGRTCSLRRDKTGEPTKITIVPCCKYLTCAGIGPKERRNGFDVGVGGDQLYSTGVCSLILDNDQGARDMTHYADYVNGL